ncbi:putative death-inducer obliterator 1-like [Sesbania bispinosa]|nr:putative death-inducer obliterator 1-like [Sesbania bispinosa]
MHNFHLRPHILNQSFAGSPHQPLMNTQYLQAPMNVTHSQRNLGPQWVPSIQQGNNIQPSGGPPYTAWSPHVSRSRGF